MRTSEYTVILSRSPREWEQPRSMPECLNSLYSGPLGKFPPYFFFFFFFFFFFSPAVPHHLSLNPHSLDIRVCSGFEKKKRVFKLSRLKYNEKEVQCAWKKKCRIKIYVRRKPSSGSGIYRVTRTRYLKSPLDFSDFRCLRIGRTTGHFSSTEEPEVRRTHGITISVLIEKKRYELYHIVKQGGIMQ